MTTENLPKEVLASRVVAGTGDRLAELAPAFECKSKGELAALVLEKFVAAGGVMPGESLPIARPAFEPSILPTLPEVHICEVVDRSPYIPTPYARTSETSKAAAESIAEAAPAIRKRIHERIAESLNGMTCDEVEAAMGLSHQTASARVHELRKLGMLLDVGEKRPTRSGRNATVWYAVGV